MAQSYAEQWVMKRNGYIALIAGRPKKNVQDWDMLFNLEKCSVSHMGKRNQELSCEMGGKVLKASEEERDLGVIMHRSSKPSRQCADASIKANSNLRIIRRKIVTRYKDTILRLYELLVRPQLEYCIQV